MKRVTKTAALCDEFFGRVLPFSLIFVVAANRALAGGCSFEPQGEGRVAAVIDARSFRLEDGREIRLAGIEPVAAGKAKAEHPSALAAIIAGREVTLSGE